MLFFRSCVGSLDICSFADCSLYREMIIHRSTNLLSVDIDFRRHTLCYSCSKIIDNATNLTTALRFDYGLMKYAIINSIKLFRRWYVYHLLPCCSFINVQKFVSTPMNWKELCACEFVEKYLPARRDISSF